MSLISVLIVLIIVGVLLWAVNTYIPMVSWMKNLINIVAIIFVLLWLLQAFGLMGPADLRLR